ncbi:hypothetical protein MKX01_007571 [Papaver californicum]|nr:hypothetical protein MKX01_007571 [Papaver californicum]
MAKMSVFLICFFLSVLIAMPTSSSSRMILQKEQEVVPFRCLKLITELCSAVTGCRGACPPVQCPNARDSPCCGCKVCC